MNIGKVFEKDFKDSFADIKDETSIDRLYDGVGGYAVRNICDFIVYKYPNEFYFELKNYKGNKLSFTCLTDFQYMGMKKKIGLKGVYAGILFNFREYDKAYFIPISEVVKRKEKGINSMTLEEASKVGVLMPILKKRKVTILYDVKTLLQNIQEG